LLREVLKKEAPEFVFSLIARHIRDMYWANLEDNNLSYPSWRISKLKSQARKFKEGGLKDLIQKLSEIDVNVKTTRDNITDSLDLLFATELE
jgi:hypothetical protein